MSQGVRPRVSYADLCQQSEDGRRYEIYDGEVFVVPSPLPLHQIVSMNITDWVRHQPRTREGLTLAAPLDIVLSEYDVVQPDIVYFEPHRLQDLSLRVAIRVPPDLAIEVLSPTPSSADRGRKRHLLARHGVRECWLVDPEELAVEIHALEGTAFSLVGTVGDEHALSSPLLGHMTDPVAGLFHSPI